LLPAEAAGFGRDDIGQTGLFDRDFGAAGDGPEHRRGDDLARRRGILEAVGGDDPLVRDEFAVLAAEGMRLAEAKCTKEMRKRPPGFGSSS
jgi:hypothetical protein